MFSCEFCEISQKAFFTEHLRTTDSAFSLSKAATGGVLGKKVFLKISENLQENTFGLLNFQNHLFYRTPLDDCFWLFRATLLRWDTASSVWKTSDEYSLYKTLEVLLRYIISFFSRINFQCMSSLAYIVYCQKQPSE